MGRSYHLSKKLQAGKADEILSEINSIPEIKQACFSPDLDYLDVETKDQEYFHAMSCIVNIFHKTGDGCSLSFSRFVL